MAYKVGLPKNNENFTEGVTQKPESPSRVPLLKNTGDSGDSGDRLTEGRIVAVEICSDVVGGAHIWLALDDSFDPGDGQAVFYADELPF